MKNIVERVANLPVAFFSVVMGLSGLAMSWRQAHDVVKFNFNISDSLSWLALAAFIIIFLAYLVKVFKYPDMVKAEFSSGEQIGFFATISVSFILISICMLDIQSGLSFGFWLVGTLGHLSLTLVVVNRWIYHTDNSLSSITPVWFIPTVGNILVPVAGVKFAPTEFAWFFFSLGLLLWMIIFIMLLFRLFFDEPLPMNIIPTMFIMLAPPAVAFISWMSFNLELDFFARFLYYSALFIFLLLFSKIFGFARLPFTLGWWAYSFPLAAMTVASFKMYELTSMNFLLLFAWGLLGLLSVLIAYLIVRTIIAVKRHEILPVPQ